MPTLSVGLKRKLVDSHRPRMYHSVSQRSEDVVSFEVEPAAIESAPAHRVRRGKNAPTGSSRQLILRPRLSRELARALSRRLTVAVADAGYGKSVALAEWARSTTYLWYALDADDAGLTSLLLGIADVFAPPFPELSAQLRQAARTPLGPDGDESDRAAQAAALLCEGLEQELRDELVLVFDDLHELGRAGPSVRLVEEICRQAPVRLHVVLSSRLDPPFPIQRLRGRGDVLDVDAKTLAFCDEEVAELLEVLLGPDAVPLATEVFELTAGWPAAVRLTAEAIRGVGAGERAAAVRALRRPGGQLLAYVAEEVLGRVTPEVRQLLRQIAVFDRFDEGLAKAIGVDAPSESLAALRRAGLLLEAPADDRARLGMHALVRTFVIEHWPLDTNELRELHGAAAVWFERQAAYDEALDSLVAIDDRAGIARVLSEHGQKLLAAGKVDSIIRTVECVPQEMRTRQIEQLLGEAREIRGDWDEALRCFERAEDGDAGLEPALAWRIGMIHHHRGNLDDALEAYARGELNRGDPRDAALLLAWQSTAYWLRGEEAACREAAAESLVRAREADDPTALAAAHNALAMHAALSGDRLANDAHYLRALEYAERAGDVLQAVRVRANRGSRYLEEGEYDQALGELEIATQLAELTGFAFFRALALTNRGEVELRLGRLEEARTDLESAKDLYLRSGSRMVSYPLALLGDVARERGDTAKARGLYEEAIAQSEYAGDVQGLVPPVAALAQLLADEDPPRARALARRAIGLGEGMAQVSAHVAAGWVALAAGDRDSATGSAEAAAAVARRRRDRAGLAHALVLEALAADDRRRQVARLDDALSLWRGIGEPLGEARAEVLLGMCMGGDAGAALTQAAEGRLRDAGANGYRLVLASILPSLLPHPSKPVTISTLGRFGVLRDGRPVAHDEWQSKKARDLLKILVVRRGRRTPRDILMEALWPADDPNRLSNRLSVALSTLRSVLDPEHSHPADYFVATYGDAVELRLAQINVDAEQFLEAGGEGLGLRRNDDDYAARVRLESAEAMYLGDFLEEDLYEDWAIPFREELRAMYLAVATALAELAEAANDFDAAVRYRLRVLERDPYDEGAHLGVARALIEAGRHGEARRSYRRYVARMTELGIEASPFPAPRVG